MLGLESLFTRSAVSGARREYRQGRAARGSAWRRWGGRGGAEAWRGAVAECRSRAADRRGTQADGGVKCPRLARGGVRRGGTHAGDNACLEP